MSKIIGLEKERSIVELGVKGNIPMLLIGETGQGKTSLVRDIAREQGKSLVRISLNGKVTTEEIIGKWLISNGSTYWQDGTLLQAIRRGDWVVLDELNACRAEILHCLNPLLDDERALRLSEKDGEIVPLHPECRIFATMNPPEEYAGTNELNKALLSRFGIVLEIGYYTPEEELKILQEHTTIDDVSGRIIVDVGNSIRKLKNDNTITYTCSTRDLISWARLFSINGHTLAETFKYAILFRVPDDEKKAVVEGVNTACDIKFNWQSKRETLVKKLTSDLAMSIEKLKAKREALEKAVDELEKALNNVQSDTVAKLKAQVSKTEEE